MSQSAPFPPCLASGQNNVMTSVLPNLSWTLDQFPQIANDRAASVGSGVARANRWENRHRVFVDAETDQVARV